MKATRITGWLERTVTFLQTTVAGLLVVLLLLGVVSLGFSIGRWLLAPGSVGVSRIVTLIGSAIDIVLYLFIVVELYKTVIAYVEAKSVVMAVIHAGLIAIVRQILTFKPTEYETTKALAFAGVYGFLLFALLVGFYFVHSQLDEDAEVEVE